MIIELTLAQWSAIGGLLVAITTLLPRTRKFFLTCWRKTIGRTEALLEQHITEERDQLNRIEAELHPNGGNSLRDALNELLERMHEFDAFLRAQLNIHDVALLRTDATGELTMVNRQYTRLTGFSLDEVRGSGWINAVHPEDRTRIKKLWTLAVTEQREFHEDVKFERPNGEAWIGHANVYKEMDSRGKLCGYLGVVIPEPVSPCPYAGQCVGAPSRTKE